MTLSGLGRVGVVATSALLAGWPLRIIATGWGHELGTACHYGDGTLYVVTGGVFALGSLAVLIGLGLALLWRKAGLRDYAVIMLAQLVVIFLAMYSIGYAMSHLHVDRGNETLLPFLDPTDW